MSKTEQKRYKIPKNSHIGKNTEFSKDYQPTPEAKSEGQRLYWQEQKLKEDFKRVCLQAYNKIENKESAEKTIKAVREWFPDIPEERINYVLATFIRCFKQNPTPRDLKILLEIAGIIDTKAQVEINANVNVAPIKIDVESLRLLMEIMK